MIVRRALKLVQKCGNKIHTKTITNVAFIGVGNMGSRMASNLIKKGQHLNVYDALPSNAEAIEGGKCCDSPEDAVKNAPIVITMLPNGDAVKQTFLGEKGIFKSVPKNSLLIDCSTIEPKIAQELSDISLENGVRFIDAPVSGGITGAEAATLTFMVGGDDSNVKLAEPILLQMGARVLHCGKPGAGQIAKLCNNLILGATMIATAEGMNLGIKLGLDPKILTSVVNVSSGRSWSSDTYNPIPGVMEHVPASRNYEGGFAVKLMAKDLGLAENAALMCDAPVPLGAVAHQLYRTLLVNGYGTKDFTSIYELLKGK